MVWLTLIAAGLLEVGFTTFIKLSHGFTRLWPSLGFLVLVPLSLWLLSTSLEEIPVGTTYAIWTGIGAVGTILVGVLGFKERVSRPQQALLGLLIVSLIGLRFVSDGA
jgi:quaternary ammonium compound-resistance protein SugE